MGIFKKINNIETLVKDIDAILTLDKPYYEKRIDELEEKNVVLGRENKELREIIKKFETPLEKPKNSPKKATKKGQNESKK